MAQLPANAAARFTIPGFHPYEIPDEWVDLVEEWTEILAAIDPNFQYEQIKVKFNAARVYAAGKFGDSTILNEDGESVVNPDWPLYAMERALNEVLVNE